MTVLNPKGILFSPDGATSPVSVMLGDPKYQQVCLNISPETFAALRRLAEAGGISLDDVIAKAFILYEAAADASRRGKAVGIAPSADVLEMEFVGF